jgi:hypothetical protein
VFYFYFYFFFRLQVFSLLPGKDWGRKGVQLLELLVR